MRNISANHQAPPFSQIVTNKLVLYKSLELVFEKSGGIIVLLLCVAYARLQDQTTDNFRLARMREQCYVSSWLTEGI